MVIQINIFPVAICQLRIAMFKRLCPVGRYRIAKETIGIFSDNCNSTKSDKLGVIHKIAAQF